MDRGFNTVAYFISQIKALIVKANEVKIKLQRPGISPGGSQALSRELQHKTKKVASYFKKLDSLSKGSITSIDFTVDNDPGKYRVVYTNLSEQDSKDLITLVFEVQGKKIEILECKRVLTDSQIIRL